MLTKPIKILLFLSSYSPLFLLLIIKISDKIAIIPILLVIVTLILACIPFLLIKVFTKFKNKEAPVTIKEINYKDGDTMSYVVTYLLPFLSITGTPKDVISIFILFFVLMILYINSNLVFINPVLSMFGYHIYEIQTTSNKTLILITKKDQLVVSSQVNLIKLDTNTYYLGE